MLDTERRKLFDPKREYLNLGVNGDGEFYSVTPIMWVNGVSAHKMRTPDVYITPADLLDREIFDRIRSLCVLGLYIYVPLEDYNFISELSDLRDIHIECAEGLKSLDFLHHTPECELLFLHKASLPDIDAVWEVKSSGVGFMPMEEIGLYDCNIGRATEPYEPKQRFYEFLVWSRPENAERDRNMWTEVASSTKRYFVLKPKE